MNTAARPHPNLRRLRWTVGGAINAVGLLLLLVEITRWLEAVGH